MKAFVKTTYGGPEVLTLQEVPKPPVKDSHILIRVMANSANPADWHILRGKPAFARLSFGLFKPKNKILGADFAGIVEETGNNVTRFKSGERVFGETLTSGSFAEYTVVPESACALMPAGVGFPEMACVPIAGLTAIQALITHGKIQPGESVLINGAAGGVGHLAVQIAKMYGGKVTAVCSGKNAEFVKSLGADRVISYDMENIHHHTTRYDLIVDIHGNFTFGDFTRMGRRAVMVGFTTMGNMMSVLSRKAFSKFPLTQFTAAVNAPDLELLASLLAERKIRIHIDKTYPSEKIPEAIGYIEAMHTRGKVAMVWQP
jgi:NADPH:quinone reductase-like Zn-dependent oxidoreductase